MKNIDLTYIPILSLRAIKKTRTSNEFPAKNVVYIVVDYLWWWWRQVEKILQSCILCM